MCKSCPPPFPPSLGPGQVSCNFESDWCKWTNVGARDWRRHAGGTSSSGTGPSAAQEGSFYVYTEASGRNRGYPQQEFILQTGPLGLSVAANVSFSYHMYGSTMGSLAVEYQEGAGGAGASGGAWTSIFSQSGDQGNEWKHALATLPQTASRLRLKAITGSSYRSDVAVDNITLVPLETVRAEMVMTAEQTFVAQTLGHEFVFQLGGMACSDSSVFFDATDGSCQQLCPLALVVGPRSVGFGVRWHAVAHPMARLSLAS